MIVSRTIQAWSHADQVIHPVTGSLAELEEETAPQGELVLRSGRVPQGGVSWPAELPLQL